MVFTSAAAIGTGQLRGTCLGRCGVYEKALDIINVNQQREKTIVLFIFPPTYFPFQTSKGPFRISILKRNPHAGVHSIHTLTHSLIASQHLQPAHLYLDVFFGSLLRHIDIHIYPGPASTPSSPSQCRLKHQEQELPYHHHPQHLREDLALPSSCRCSNSSSRRSS